MANMPLHQKVSLGISAKIRFFEVRRYFTLAIVMLVFSKASSMGNPWDTLKLESTAFGITPTVVYDSVATNELFGGEKSGITYAGAVHFQAIVDGDRLFSLSGLTLYLDILNTHGGQPDGLVGDIQGVSNIASPPTTEIYEGWFQYNLSNVSVLVGRYDLNSEFYRLLSSSLFLNSSFGIGPEFSQSGLVGASIYPDTALGARLIYKPNDDIVLRTAVMDGVSVERPAGFGGLFSGRDGLLIMSEAAFLSRPGEEMAPGAMRSLLGRLSSLPPYEDKIAFGGWYYTASFNDLSARTADGLPLTHRGSAGVYALLDKRLFEDDSAWLSGFLQAGLGDARVNRVGSYVGVGVNAGGLIPTRPTDQFGIALAVANNGRHFLMVSPASSRDETTLELTYVSPITSWLAVQPDVQFVWHPSSTPDLKDATLFQLQIETSF